MKLDAARWEVIMAWLMGHFAPQLEQSGVRALFEASETRRFKPRSAVDRLNSAARILVVLNTPTLAGSQAALRRRKPVRLPDVLRPLS